MSALDALICNHGNYKGISNSTNLGRVKLKKKGNKSLEGLTKIPDNDVKEVVQLTSVPIKGSHDNGAVAPRTTKRSSKGYQQKRRDLHKSRSKGFNVGKTSSIESDISFQGQRSQRSQGASQENEVRRFTFFSMLTKKFHLLFFRFLLRQC